NIPAAISPVKAPKFCSLMFCAPSRRLESRMALETASNAVNGGHTTMSTSLTLASSSFKLRTRSSASATVLFIFQFPAMISFRSLFIGEGHCVFVLSFFRQYRDSWQDFPFEKLQAGAPARAHEGHFVPELRPVNRFHAVTAADDALRAVLLGHLRHRPSDGIRPLGEPFVLEQSHRPVPQNGFGSRHRLRIGLNGGRPDIQAGGIIRAILIRAHANVLVFNDGFSLFIQSIGFDRRRD